MQSNIDRIDFIGIRISLVVLLRFFESVGLHGILKCTGFPFLHVILRVFDCLKYHASVTSALCCLNQFFFAVIQFENELVCLKRPSIQNLLRLNFDFT